MTRQKLPERGFSFYSETETSRDSEEEKCSLIFLYFRLNPGQIKERACFSLNFLLLSIQK